jgi:hypothetical protein
MHGGLFVTLLKTFPCWLGYAGPVPQTLRSGWDLWWLLQGGVHNRRGNLTVLASYFPKVVVTEEVVASAAACHAKRLDWRVAWRVVLIGE